MPDHARAHPAAPIPRPAAPIAQATAAIACLAMLIPRRLLIAAGPLGGLDAEQVAAAIARGLQAGGSPTPDVLALPGEKARAEDLRELLESSSFDARMRAARAVVVAVERLGEDTLASSPAFEIATRARQAGVPAYAVTAANELDAFDARILDLQLIVEAEGRRGLSAAGRRLAGIV